jgi:hypothetical protein
MMVKPARAQMSTSSQTANAICTFTDGKEISVRYHLIPEKSQGKLPTDTVWTPGNEPMDMFTQTPLSVGGSQIPIGAYAMYLIPGKKDWTLVLNKNVTEGSKYDEQQDLVRVPMQIGRLSEAQTFSIGFAHIAPKQCNIRVYYGKDGTWAELTEK